MSAKGRLAGIGAIIALCAIVLLVAAVRLTSGQLTGLASGSGGNPSNTVFPCPVSPSQGFHVGWCYHSPKYLQNNHREHNGMDMANGKCGDDIRAVSSGKATFWESRPGWLDDSVVEIDHGNGWYSRYLHMSDFGSRPFSGVYTDNVQAGEVIGHVGTKGFSDACHLHLEILYGGTDPSNRLDPWQYACLDIPAISGAVEAGRCTAGQINYHPGGAATFGSMPLGGPGGSVSTPSTSILTAKTPYAKVTTDRGYAFDISWKANLDYSLDEYELLKSFVRDLGRCQQDSKGTAYCIGGMENLPSYRAMQGHGLSMLDGDCSPGSAAAALKPDSKGYYTFCAESKTAFPFAEKDMIILTPVHYRFAVRLADLAAPPQPTGLVVSASATAPDTDILVKWDRTPAADLDYYQLTITGKPPEQVETTSETVSGLRPGTYTVTLVAMDTSGHASASISTVFTMPGAVPVIPQQPENPAPVSPGIQPQ